MEQGIINFWATSDLGKGASISRPPPGQPPVINRAPPPFYPTYPSIVTPPNTIPTISAVTQTPMAMSYSSKCGLFSNPSPPLIAGGIISWKRYPSMVAIIYNLKGEHEYHCTGSLVTNKHVITAAHCVHVKKSFLVPKEVVLIILGLFDIGTWLTDTEATIAKVSDISVHPDFNSTNGDSDVAVFTLTEEIKFTPYIIPICIWNEDEDLKLVEKEQGIAAEWNTDRSVNAKMNFATYVEMPIVSQVVGLRSNPKFRSAISSRTFCAGKRDGNGPCNGDRGGPFMLNRRGRWTLRGVLSRSLSDFENQCDVSNYFIFADIAKARSWLDGVLI